MLLGAVVQVFEDFRYTDHTETGDTATLAFSARVGGPRARRDRPAALRRRREDPRDGGLRAADERRHALADGDGAEARGDGRPDRLGAGAAGAGPELVQARGQLRPSAPGGARSRAGSRARTGRRRGRRAPPRRSRAGCRCSRRAAARMSSSGCSRTAARGRCRRWRSAANGTSERPSMVSPALALVSCDDRRRQVDVADRLLPDGVRREAGAADRPAARGWTPRRGRP